MYVTHPSIAAPNKNILKFANTLQFEMALATSKIDKIESQAKTKLYFTNSRGWTIIWHENIGLWTNWKTVNYDSELVLNEINDVILSKYFYCGQNTTRFNKVSLKCSTWITETLWVEQNQLSHRNYFSREHQKSNETNYIHHTSLFYTLYDSIIRIQDRKQFRQFQYMPCRS